MNTPAMDLGQAIKARHAVRRYTDRPIDADVVSELRGALDDANSAGGHSFQLVLDEPKAFTGPRTIGQFRSVRNYLALVGAKGPAAAESCGYHGERLVLRAVQLGLDTCWVGLTYNKRAMPISVGPGQTVHAVIALGYGQAPGQSHKVKPIEALTTALPPFPEWFRRGLEAAQLGPSAMNQQRFRFEADFETNTVRGLPGGHYGDVDLGIAKCHFEIGAGLDGWQWTSGA